jgi:hypothetical protein
LLICHAAQNAALLRDARCDAAAALIAGAHSARRGVTARDSGVADAAFERLRDGVTITLLPCFDATLLSPLAITPSPLILRRRHRCRHFIISSLLTLMPFSSPLPIFAMLTFCRAPPCQPLRLCPPVIVAIAAIYAMLIRHYFRHFHCCHADFISPLLPDFIFIFRFDYFISFAFHLFSMIFRHFDAITLSFAISIFSSPLPPPLILIFIS